MKNIKLIGLLLLLFSISTVTYAREINPRKGIEISKGYRSRFIKENKKIRICFVDSSKTAVRGRFSVVNDSTIAINNENYTLSNISSIQHQRMGNVVSGIALTYIGLGYTAIGLEELDYSYGSSKSNPSNKENEQYFYLSIALTAVGVLMVTQGVIYLVNGRRYKLEGKWTAAIVEN